MPWAKRHTWQSWRNRYKKHQNWFDHKIKKYQKELRVRVKKHANHFSHLQILKLLFGKAKVEVQPQPVQVTQTKLPEQVSAKSGHSPSSSSDSEDEEDSEEEDNVGEAKDREELYAELFGISQFSEESEGETSDPDKK